MSSDESIPSTAQITIAGVSSCLIAGIGCALTVATFLFTSFNPQIQRRWLIIFACGVIPALIAAPSFVVGLRQHDLGQRRAALRAFAMSLVGLPVMLVGVALLIDSLRA